MDSQPGADLRASALEMSFEGLRFTVEYRDQESAASLAAGRAKSTHTTSWPPAARLLATGSIGKPSRAELPIAGRSPAGSNAWMKASRFWW